MIVGTAGHIDHGKSSLVKAITGIDTDRLKEEKARGITIELGFAYWPRPATSEISPGRALDRIIGFVDVPGHERLVHTMLAGASGIDHVLLCVAADDGVMPQTREHLAILGLLGLERGVMVMTKADLADAERRAEVAAAIRAAAAGSPFADAEIIPVSTVSGEGLDALKAHLDRALAASARRDSAGRYRHAIDRVFSLAGAGTVVTGTILSGRVRIGDQVMVSPRGIPARVRSIHAQGRSAEEARAGERAAIALVGPDVSTEAVTRGDVVLEPTLHAPVRRLDARLTVLASEKRPLGQWTPVHLHHAAQMLPARLVPLDAEAMAPGGQALVQIVLEAPLAGAAVGDRFVLRDAAAERTIGGGVFLDLAPPERRRRTPERLAELAVRREADAFEVLRGLLAGPRGWIDIDVFWRERATDAAMAEEAARRLDLVILNASGQRAAFLADGFADYRDRLLAHLAACHTTRPDLPGVGQEPLRLALSPRLPAPVFSVLLARLQTEGLIKLDRAWVRLASHEVRLSAEEEQLWRDVQPRLGGEMRFRPPRVRDLARDIGMEEPAVRRVMKLAARRGEVDEVAHDHFFLSEAVVEMATIARTLAGEAEDGRFAVIAFRDKLDNGRKVAIQVLEFFDAQGLTMRRGDFRRINPHKANLFAAGQAKPGGVDAT